MCPTCLHLNGPILTALSRPFSLWNTCPWFVNFKSIWHKVKDSEKDADPDAEWNSLMGQMPYSPCDRPIVHWSKLNLSFLLKKSMSLPPCNLIIPPSSILSKYVWMTSPTSCNKTHILVLDDPASADISSSQAPHVGKKTCSKEAWKDMHKTLAMAEDL